MPLSLGRTSRLQAQWSGILARTFSRLNLSKKTPVGRDSAATSVSIAVQDPLHKVIDIRGHAIRNKKIASRCPQVFKISIGKP